MTDKVQKIREEVERLKSLIDNNSFLSDYEKGCNDGREDMCDELISFIDSLQAEPVSKDMEEASYYFACKCHPLKTEYSTSSPNPEVVKAFKVGANWQKQQMMKDAVDAKIGDLVNGIIYDVDFNVDHNFEKNDKVKVIIIKSE